MASTAWYEIYQSYSDAELAAEIATLKKRNTGFSSISSPTGKSHTAALDELREQMAAAIRVQTDRSGCGQPRSFVADFSTWAQPFGGKGMASQVLGTMKDSFQMLIGDGAATQFVVPHNLNASGLFVTVEENKGNARRLDSTEYAVIFNTPNQLTVYFTVAPSVRQYLLTVAVGGVA
jgi:hypothetical protein